jgi:DNA-binding MarR family transcriptional regulator
VLGHGRGPLQPGFAPHDLTLAELHSLLGELREVSDVPPSTAGLWTGTSSEVIDQTKVTPEALAQLPPGPMCDAVANHLDTIVKALANESRNAAVKGPLVQLVRLGQQGHHGVMDAVGVVREDFIGRVTPDRPGGAAEANQEWSRLLAGAIRIVFPRGITSRPPAPCLCLLPSLHLAMRQDRFFSANSRARATERSVLAHLFKRAEYRQSLRLEVAQRPIAEAIDVTQHTVNVVLRRLEGNGWITREHQRLFGSSDFITLTFPTTCVATTSTSTPTVEGLLVDVVMTGWVNRLFGPMGLGAGPAVTFSALPEWSRQVRGGRLMRVMPGSSASELLLNPQQGKRRIPAAPAGPGLTVKELARKTGKATRTMARHLKKFSWMGLAFRDDQGRWWRYRFDPDEVADRNCIPHTAELKADRHIRDRRSFLNGRIAYDRARNLNPRVERVYDGDGTCYVDTRTGEVLWIDLWEENESPPE